MSSLSERAAFAKASGLRSLQTWGSHILLGESRSAEAWASSGPSSFLFSASSSFVQQVCRACCVLEEFREGTSDHLTGGVPPTLWVQRAQRQDRGNLWLHGGLVWLLMGSWNIRDASKRWEFVTHMQDEFSDSHPIHLSFGTFLFGLDSPTWEIKHASQIKHEHPKTC